MKKIPLPIRPARPVITDEDRDSIPLKAWHIAALVGIALTFSAAVCWLERVAG